MNLEPETRNGYYISKDMKKVWAVEMELLKKLLEVCEKHHLKIWAEGGTLLGNVWHHGYIPWDDDIDMAMPRKDYDKLQSVAKEEFKKPFFFQSGFTDIFPNGLSRIRMDRTTAILKHTIFQKHHQGIFIDISPLDVIPDNHQELMMFLEERDNEKEKLKLYCESHLSLSNLKHNWNIFKIKREINKIGYNTYFKKYDQIVKQFANSDFKRVSIFSWSPQSKYYRNRDWYHNTVYLQFEDIKMPVPADYDSILTKQFGDYMKPVKEPTMHGGFVILDPEKSYKYYLPLLRKEHRWDHWKTKIHFLIDKFK